MEKRLDVYLTENMNIKSRTKAQDLIRGGFVTVNGILTKKTGVSVSDSDLIEIRENDVLKYVSRGGLKLEKALDSFGVDLKGKVVLDIGSSTGGFTDCALQHGARKVIAVDVGTNIMDIKLRGDSRVELHEETDIRDFDIEGYDCLDFCVCDASFISLPVALSGLGKSGRSFKLITLIKPQFECGPKAASKYKGVISDKGLHLDILKQVLSAMRDLGFTLIDITYSPIRGKEGNIEYLAYFSHEPEETGKERDMENSEAFGNLESLVDEAACKADCFTKGREKP